MWMLSRAVAHAWVMFTLPCASHSQNEFSSEEQLATLWKLYIQSGFQINLSKTANSSLCSMLSLPKQAKMSKIEGWILVEVIATKITTC